MTNIWRFLLQTLTVSLVAGIILVVKKLLEDKLSPRWQYGVWILLVLRILLPVSTNQKIIIPLPLWIEILKTWAEALLHSNYSAMYEPVGLQHVFPVFEETPSSITDWLFVIYIVGIVLCLLKYFISYMRLRQLLKKRNVAPKNIQDKVQFVCKKYGLKSCKVVEVPGLTSAFICGGFLPVLAVPAGEETDEKILLHELLHLKYHDTLQNIGWCVLRAFHWCNPFLQYVFNYIGNDMEALCDQRVLERLEGEERRAYGVILLSMANERYARTAGTSSISNGGKNISRRIESIVRFKKYPEGMALVSVCIVFVMASPTVMGMANGYTADEFKPKELYKQETALAMSRINRCTTLAGALDTYAKGLMYNNGIFLAVASPMEQQENFAEQLDQRKNDSWPAYYLKTGNELEYLDMSAGYYVCNLRKVSEELYTAVLSFDVKSFIDPEAENEGEVIKTEDGYARSGCVQIPVEIRKEAGWIVEETAERTFVPEYSWSAINKLEPMKKMEAAGNFGTCTVYLNTRYHVNIMNQGAGGFFAADYADETPQLNKVYDDGFLDYQMEYSLEGKTVEGEPERHVGTMFKGIDSLEEEVEFPIESRVGNLSGGNSNGFTWTNRSVDEEWDGTLLDGGGGSYELKDGLVPLPKAARIQIYWDGELVEEMVAEEVAP